MHGKSFLGSLQTALFCYNVRMRIICNDLILKHPGNNAESPERVLGVVSNEVSVDLIAAADEVSKLYKESNNNLNSIKRKCDRHFEIAEARLNGESYDAILTSVSLGMNALNNGDFALVRPPGHHANLTESRGFCIINNLAVVINKPLNEGKKISIIDFDGHHGDGTHDIFKDNPSVQFCSIFEKDAYPFVSDKNIKSNSNGLYVPLEMGAGDRTFDEILDFFIKNIKKFKPDIIAVSAGFDAYHADPLLNLKFTEHAYYNAGSKIRSLGIHTFAILEGGYHNNLNNCIRAFISGFNMENFAFNEEKNEL
jgi:acetoin utilization deacetylase AcuC-like enzyme